MYINKWKLGYLVDRWPFQECEKIIEMDDSYVFNCYKMIKEGRGKIQSDNILAKAFLERFELELRRRKYKID